MERRKEGWKKEELNYVVSVKKWMYKTFISRALFLYLGAFIAYSVPGTVL